MTFYNANKRSFRLFVNRRLEITNDGGVITDRDLNMGFREKLASLEHRLPFGEQAAHCMVMLLFLLFQKVQAPVNHRAIQPPQYQIAGNIVSW